MKKKSFYIRNKKSTLSKALGYAIIFLVMVTLTNAYMYLPHIANPQVGKDDIRYSTFRFVRYHPAPARGQRYYEFTDLQESKQVFVLPSKWVQPTDLHQLVEAGYYNVSPPPFSSLQFVHVKQSNEDVLPLDTGLRELNTMVKRKVGWWYSKLYILITLVVIFILVRLKGY